jgi:hypothetical protein
VRLVSRGRRPSFRFKLKITRYIESLTSAGQNDAQRLAVYRLAYLKELHEGRDPRFTGC